MLQIFLQKISKLFIYGWKQKLLIVVGIILAFIVASFYWIGIKRITSDQRIKSQPTPADYKSQQSFIPTEKMLTNPTALPLPQGKQRYFVSGKVEPGKSIVTEIVFDPFDPKPNEWQTVNVKTKTIPEVETVSILMITDRGEQKYELKRMIDERDSTIWEGSWGVKDTHINQYRAMVIGENQAGKTKIIMTLR